ncbi:phenylacetic acid degradation bifunctional protein PaaZ [Paramagnetospirillum marisnigri]|uniref:Phenylacetic acid degradation bifunctional protein PaaZ n=1 Tax=Paramagnetospirillum marisnigri TaxID=1285242 RepID=A0A178MU07_9PROT|nr:3,4-dehydroadipyl-CoA semialdehyde dehydrogenase [Paramagnetospirillum marisnigri]OAN52244.1 phenylacetic acid degradation bifunctional protein PaaZ [Paramagnetospirillum marisnigri]
MIRLQSYLAGRWQDGSGPGAQLTDPVTGEELATASGDGLDLAEALDFARAKGGPALRALTFAARAGLINAVAGVLAENRERYNAIALANSGNTAMDAMLDVDGGIGTLKYYASLGRKLGEVHTLVEAGSDQLSKDENFRSIHLWTTVHGAAVHINAFNFPSWGLWEKAAVSLLAGVPFLAKPATATALLAYEMVKDVIAANVLPEGALSLLCGGGRDLMDHLKPGDVVAFTGSADTALMLRSHPNVTTSNIRFAVEADSLNLCALGPDVTPDSPEFTAFIKEVVRELTVKSGQKCTAIRRILVPRNRVEAVTAAMGAAFAKIKQGDPRDPDIRMGPLVNASQTRAALDGLVRLAAEARVVAGGGEAKGNFLPPTLLLCDLPTEAHAVHEVEVFGPVATLMPYDSMEQAIALARKGGGSLAASVFSGDSAFTSTFVPAIATAHGRVLVVDATVAASQTGHGVVMPHCVHGGPGRAGGGEELGGLRGLRFYMQRTAIQGNKSTLEGLAAVSATVAL